MNRAFTKCHSKLILARFWKNCQIQEFPVLAAKQLSEIITAANIKKSLYKEIPLLLNLEKFTKSVVITENP